MQPAFAAPAPGPDPVRMVFDRLRAGLEGKTYENWIDGKITLAVADDELTVGVGSPFLLAWMQRQFSTVMRTAAREALGPSARLRFVVDGRIGLPAGRGGVTTAAAREPVPRAGESAVVTSVASAETGDDGAKSAEPGDRDSPEKKRAQPAQVAGRRYCDLADFVCGPHADLAYASALRLCESPSTFPGPLYLFGGVGLGKTHMLEGIAQRLRRSTVGKQVVYFTAEAFSNYFTEALRGRSLPSFRNRFRGVDVLVVDDVDFFDGKRGLQEEFLHTVQHIERQGRMIVLAADRHPKMLTKTSEELVSRFVAGTVCRIDRPDFESRLRILEQKATRTNARLEAPVLKLIAEKFRGSVRELEGALNCLDVFRSVTGRAIGVTAARQALGELERDCLRAVRLPDIERVVCEVFGVGAEALRSPNRARSVSQPRMLAMYLARKLTPAAYGEIGAHFGGRNHSTVIAAERKVLRLLGQTETWTVAAEQVALGDLVRSIESRVKAS